MGTVAGNQTLDPNLSVPEAIRFLQLLGKDPAQTWFRTITPVKGANRRRNGRDLRGFDAAALEADNLAGSSIYFITGDADQATGKNTKTGHPTGAVDDKDVDTCRAVFVEWDDRPIEWQVQAWRVRGTEDLAMVNPTQLHPGEWLRTVEAVHSLGISRDTLLRRCRDGYLRPGEHYIASGPHRTSPRIWSIEAVRRAMAGWTGVHPPAAPVKQ